jgi:hypothetical protein
LGQWLVFYTQIINPATEEIDNLDKDIIEAIVETYSQDQEDNIKEEGDKETKPPVSISEAICALEILQ